MFGSILKPVGLKSGANVQQFLEAKGLDCVASSGGLLLEVGFCVANQI